MFETSKLVLNTTLLLKHYFDISRYFRQISRRAKNSQKSSKCVSMTRQRGYDYKRGYCIKSLLAYFCRILRKFALFLQPILVGENAQKRTKKRQNVQKCTKARYFAQTHATPSFIKPPLACTQMSQNASRHFLTVFARHQISGLLGGSEDTARVREGETEREREREREEGGREREIAPATRQHFVKKSSANKQPDASAEESALGSCMLGFRQGWRGGSDPEERNLLN